MKPLGILQGDGAGSALNPHQREMGGAQGRARPPESPLPILTLSFLLRARLRTLPGSPPCLGSLVSAHALLFPDGETMGPEDQGASQALASRLLAQTLVFPGPRARLGRVKRLEPALSIALLP